jgi:hypothetical protein
MQPHAPCDHRDPDHGDRDRRLHLVLSQLELTPVDGEHHRSNRKESRHCLQGDGAEMHSSKKQHDQKVGDKSRNHRKERLARPHVKSEERHKEHRHKHEVRGSDVSICLGPPAMGDLRDSWYDVGDPGQDLLLGAHAPGNLSDRAFRDEYQPHIEQGQEDREREKKVLVAKNARQKTA